MSVKNTATMVIHRPEVVASSGRSSFIFFVETNERGQLTNAEVSAFIEAGAALRAPPVHGPHASPVRRLVADPANTGRQNQNPFFFPPFWEDLSITFEVATTFPAERIKLSRPPRSTPSSLSRDDEEEQSLTFTASVHPRTLMLSDVPTLRSMTQLLAGGAKPAPIKLNAVH